MTGVRSIKRSEMARTLMWSTATITIIAVVFFWFKMTKERSLWHAGVVEGRL